MKKRDCWQAKLNCRLQRLGMEKQPLILIFNLFIIGSFFAQKTTLKGTVQDDLHNPLPYANVIAKSKDGSKNMQFAISDNEGYYKLIFQKNDTIIIRISYLGYTPVEYQFTATEDTQKDFILVQSSEQLDEIVIAMPVTVRGDTTTYKTDKFTDGSERKLKNVLKKLPGIAVDKNGSVTVQGRKVTKMLVDGKKFFGGNAKLAVDNIPANAVGDVEVIDNYNEVAFLKGLTDSDDMAMNIKLKEDKKNFVFGDLEGGKGNQEFYKTSANLFYYSPQVTINFIGNLNNIGETTFTFRDYLSFSGGINAVFSSNFNFGVGDFSQFLQSNDVVRSKQKFGAFNITRTTSSKLAISGYAIFSQSDMANLIESTNQYTTTLEERTINNNADNILGIGKLNLEYAKSSTEQFYFRTQVKRTNNDRNNSVSSTINEINNTILAAHNLLASTANQCIEWHKRATEKHTFSGILNYSFNKNNKDNFWQTQDEILRGIIPADNSQKLLRIFQEQDVIAHHFDGVFKHFWEINNSNHMYTTVGNKFLNQQFTTNDFQQLDDDAVNNFSSNGFGNDLDFNLNDFFVGLHYKFRAGMFTFKQGAEIHNYTWQVNQTTNVNQNKWIVLPDFYAKIEFNKSKKIQINYNLKTSFSDASRFANRFYLQSYNSVFRGNEQLENQLFHTARIYYSRFSLYRGLLLHASVHYSKRLKGVLNSVAFDTSNPDVSQQNNQFLTAKLFDNPSENFKANSHLEKTIKNIKYKLDGSLNTSNYIQEINGSIQHNKNNEYAYEVGVETLFDKFPTIEIGYRQSIGDFTLSNTNSRFVTSEPFVTVDYSFLNGFIFNFDYTSYTYQNKTFNQKNNYEIANITLSYQKENSGWTFKIRVNNLFDAQFKQSNRFSEFVISDRKTFMLPRTILCSIGYNL